MMDERQKVVMKTFTKEQLEAMPVEDLVALIGEASKPGAVFKGRGIVRTKEGKIKYDPEALPGNFGESEEDLNALP